MGIFEDKRYRYPAHYSRPVGRFHGTVTIPSGDPDVELSIEDEDGNPIEHVCFLQHLMLAGPSMENSGDTVTLQLYAGGYNSGNNPRLQSVEHTTNDTATWASGDGTVSDAIKLPDWPLRNEDVLYLALNTAQTGQDVDIDYDIRFL